MDESEQQPYSFTNYVSTLKANGMDPRLIKRLAFHAGVNDAEDAQATSRGMAYLEDLLMELIHRNLEQPDLVKPGSLSFDAKVKWAQALGEIGPKTSVVLRALARIRNPLTHTHTEVLADDGLIAQFLADLEDLWPSSVFTGPMPEAATKLNPPMTELRWKLRVGIGALAHVINNYVLLPPLRERQRPGPGEGRPDVHIHADYKPAKAR